MRLIIPGGLVLAWIVGLVAASGCHLKPTTAGARNGKKDDLPKTDAVQSPTPSGQVEELTNDAVIVNAYMKNPIAANERWVGKRVRINIWVFETKQARGRYYLSAHGPSTFWIEKQHEQEFATLKPNATCRVEATLIEGEKGDDGVVSLVYGATRLVSINKN